MYSRKFLHNQLFPKMSLFDALWQPWGNPSIFYQILTDYFTELVIATGIFKWRFGEDPGGYCPVNRSDPSSLSSYYDIRTHSPSRCEYNNNCMMMTRYRTMMQMMIMIKTMILIDDDYNHYIHHDFFKTLDMNVGIADWFV